MAQSQLQPAQYYSHPALTRYFDHIQSTPTVRKLADSLSPAFSLVTFDLDDAPKSERKVETPQKKEKRGDKVTDAIAEASENTVRTAATERNADGKAGKEKKEKKSDASDAKKGGKPAATPAEDAGEPVPSMIDLRVGHIVDSECSYCSH